MAHRLVLGGEAGGRLELHHADLPGAVLAVALHLEGLEARAPVDALRAESAGWHSEARTPAPAGGLVGLIEHLASQAAGWEDPESWASRDGKLELSFSHDGHAVIVNVVLRQYHPDGWVAYGKLALAPATLPALADEVRSFLGAVAPA